MSDDVGVFPAEPSAGQLCTTWTLDPGALILLAALGLGYVLALRRAARRAVRWPRGRVAAFFGLGLGSVAVCTLSSLSVYRTVLIWPLAVQITLLLTLCPVMLALGDPLGLVRAGLGPTGARRWDAAVRTPLVRVLTFPAVAAIAAILALLIVLRTPIAADAAQHRWAADLLAVAMLGIGGLFALPMLGVDILPNWCTPPVRFVLAFVDGLLDAVPGIVIMTGTGTLAGGFYDRIQLPWSTGAYTDRQIAGGMMLSVSEVVAVPLTIALFRAWIREDEQLARQADQEPVAPGPADIAAPDGTPAGTGLQRPWWEVDPGGLGAEGHRRGWARQSPHDR